MVNKALVRLLQAHQFVYERSGGLLGHRLLVVPTLLLRTRGRKSGKERVAALAYGRDAGDYLVTASNGGSNRPPAWLLNVEAQSAVEVQIGRRVRRATATPVRPDEADFERLWRIVNKVNRGQYQQYQRKTSREIAVVRLSPVR